MKRFKLTIMAFLGVIAVVMMFAFSGKVLASTSTIDANDFSLSSGTVSGYDNTYFTISNSNKWSLSSGHLMSTNNSGCTVTVKTAGNITINYKTTSNKKTIKVGDDTSSGYIATSGTGSFTVEDVSENTVIAFVNGTGFSSISLEIEEGGSGGGSDPETKTLTLSYNLKGGTSSPEIISQSQTVGIDESYEFTISSIVPTKDNFDFAGWTDGTTNYGPEDSITISANTTLNAIWNYEGDPNALNSDSITDFVSETQLSSLTVIDGFNFYFCNKDKRTTQKINNITTTVLHLNGTGHPQSDNGKNGAPDAVLGYHATENGTISVKTYNGSARTWYVKALIRDENGDVTGSTSIINGQSFVASSVGELVFNVTSGVDYEMYANNAAYIISASFWETVEGVTTSVFAEKNTLADTLRFVGKITGIDDLDTIDTIELVLIKGTTSSNKRVFLTTCFTAVTGTTQTCEAAEGTYYVVYRITGISDIAGATITKKLIITFKDGTKVTCAETTITV